ncbi:hypothetical protein GCM10023342_01530 [Modicisalibacter zincidurans]|uniref:Uncharacterized protein n=1 Tax=Modicisalibacter zincidurans TaxID=1178777 RepID=A0ABP9QYW8_9GAMM
MTTARKGRDAIARKREKDHARRSSLAKPSASASEETQAGLRTDAREAIDRRIASVASHR